MCEDNGYVDENSYQIKEIRLLVQTLRKQKQLSNRTKYNHTNFMKAKVFERLCLLFLHNQRMWSILVIFGIDTVNIQRTYFISGNCLGHSYYNID